MEQNMRAFKGMRELCCCGVEWLPTLAAVPFSLTAVGPPRNIQSSATIKYMRVYMPNDTACALC